MQGTRNQTQNTVNVGSTGQGKTTLFDVFQREKIASEIKQFYIENTPEIRISNIHKEILEKRRI